MATDTKYTDHELEQILGQFYRSGDADKVVPAICLMFNYAGFENVLAAGRNGPMPYYLYRVAQLYPLLWSEYKDLFEASSHNERLFILWIFSLGKDKEIKKWLLSWRENAQFKDEHSEIGTVIRIKEKYRNALDIAKITTTYDLDYLWMEFLVTGNKVAVKRIIDVLEWPDLVRGKLNEHLDQKSTDSISTDHSKNKLRTQLLAKGIVLDTECRSIYSAQDLDCFSCMDGCVIDWDQLENIASIFPFTLCNSDVGYMGAKAAAKWSLACNASQHKFVLDTCIAESKFRIGRCRLSLLEIIGSTYLGIDDFERGFDTFHNSLTINLAARETQYKEAENTIGELLTLEFNTGKQDKDCVIEPESILGNCIDTCKNLHSYRSMLNWEQQKGTHDEDISVQWEMEHISPDRFRVVQLSGNDRDEWITVADQHYRGPMFTRLQFQISNDDDLLINQVLLMDNYIDIMREVPPESISSVQASTGNYILLEYLDVDSHLLKLVPEWISEWDILSMRIWIEEKSRYLVKTEVAMNPKGKTESTEETQVVHLFTSHNEDISIYPPPFSLVENVEPDDDIFDETERLVKQRNRIWFSGALIGVIAAIRIGSQGNLDAYDTFALTIVFAPIGFFIAEIARWAFPGQRKLKLVNIDMENDDRRRKLTILHLITYALSSWMS